MAGSNFSYLIYAKFENPLNAASAKENDSFDFIILEPETMSELFNEVWAEHSEVLTDLLAKLVTMQEKAENAITTGENPKEDLLQYYEATGFEHLQKKLEAMSDEEIEVLYEETFNLV